MKRIYLLLALAVMMMPEVSAQSFSKVEGTCGIDTKWEFDGFQLTISNASKLGLIVSIADYDLQENKAPWVKKNLNVRKVYIGSGINLIGSCAFAGCKNLQDVVFEGTEVHRIGWGAFLNCTHLRNISLPIQLRNIGTIAFGNCSQLPSVKIPDHCRVDDQAFVSCVNLQSVEISPTVVLGHQVFASEVTIKNKVRHALYDKEIIRLPSYVNAGNCREYGLAKSAVEKYLTRNKGKAQEDYDYQTSDVDKNIPQIYFARNDTYALIFGNQNYRFVADVPYAIHDARIFAEYCKKTLGLPVENIHISEDATKQMMMEEELEDWLSSIPGRTNKKLIVYYAGHGVPDVKNKNKAYILPTDVRGTNPKRGVGLDEFYRKIGDYGFAQTSVFLDACFSGINRDNEGVSEGLRGVEIQAEETQLTDGAMVVFSAAQGNETAQGFPDQGHGLFTYYLLKELQESSGMVTFGTLSENLNKKVSQTAHQLKMRKKQTPVTNASESMSETWRDMGF